MPISWPWSFQGTIPVQLLNTIFRIPLTDLGTEIISLHNDCLFLLPVHLLHLWNAESNSLIMHALILQVKWRHNLILTCEVALGCSRKHVQEFLQMCYYAAPWIRINKITIKSRFKREEKLLTIRFQNCSILSRVINILQNNVNYFRFIVILSARTLLSTGEQVILFHLLWIIYITWSWKLLGVSCKFVLKGIGMWMTRNSCLDYFAMVVIKNVERPYKIYSNSSIVAQFKTFRSIWFEECY